MRKRVTMVIIKNNNNRSTSANWRRCIKQKIKANKVNIINKELKKVLIGLGYVGLCIYGYERQYVHYIQIMHSISLDVIYRSNRYCLVKKKFNVKC